MKKPIVILIAAMILSLSVGTVICAATNGNQHDGGTGDAEALQQAPLNPNFVAYWENPPKVSYGDIPPTMDLSHIDAIPVKGVRTADTLPSRFDWRDSGKVTPVKNQNPCGTCWAFGATSALESAVLMDESAEYNFSEQSVALCVDRSWVYLYDDPTDPCMTGGNCWRASEVFIKKGSVLESCNPYDCTALNCDGSCVCDDCQPVKKVDGFRVSAWDGSQINTIKNAILNKGPAKMSYYHNDTYVYSDPTWGTIHDYYPCPEGTNHAVSIVGWDDDVPHPCPGHSGTGAWIVKNSWGTGWGNGGYFYLAYGSSCVERIIHLEYKDHDPTEELLYWDEAGQVTDVGYEDGIAWMASVFTADQPRELTHVDFYTTSNNAEYEIYVWDGYFGSEITHQTGTCQECGYYSIPLNTPILIGAGQQFTVGVNMTTPGYGYPIPAECKISGDVDPPIQAGVSFIRHFSSSSWADLADYGCNAGLRARMASEPLPENTKWVQLPDLTPNGIDIKVDDERVLADDFECTFPSLLTDVHFWGSWKFDEKGEIENIHLSIHSDDPVGEGGTNPDNQYSMPDELLWKGDFGPDEFEEMLYHTMPDGLYEWWWDPVTEKLIQNGDTQVWQYNIRIDPDEAFHQNGSKERPVIYWLDISVKTNDGDFGWKTRQWPEHFMDDAVYWDGLWQELRYPQGHELEGDSIDMAFMLTFEEAVHLDWGDAPDNASAPGYPTLASSNGARHVIVPGFHLGRTIRVSQESSPGAGDFDANILGYVSPYVTANTTAGYYQYGTPYGASFNGPAPALTSDRSHLFLADTADGLSLFVVHDKPVDGSGGTTTMRWTLAGDMAGVLVLDDPGESVTVSGGGTIFDSSHSWAQCCTDGMAFGSLDGGWTMIGAFTNAISSTGMNAWHIYASDGSSIPLALETNRRVRLDYQYPIDPEPDGQPHPYALGDDNGGNDDENGVVFNTPLVPGKPAQVTVTASANGRLQGWIDFDADSSWADPGEQIFADQSLAAGTNVLTFNVPATAAIGRTFARFRFSTMPGLPFDGPAPDGEVEDYMVRIRCDCGDVDCSGTVNIMDVRLLMNHVADPTGYPVDSVTGNVDGVGGIDMADVQLLVAHVFNPAGHPLNCDNGI
jgi:C1A family cysteine protease